jgi:hypothetical protein
MLKVLTLSSCLVFFIFIALLVYIMTDGRIPASPDWLYNYVTEIQFRKPLKRDRLIGGGHFYFFDGRDLWIRFRLPENPDIEPESELAYLIRGESNDCTPQEREIVQNWFKSAIAHPNFFSRLTPGSNLQQEDVQNLEDTANLNCLFSDTIPESSNQFPSNCGSWKLYHRKTRLVYIRYACYN